MTTGVSRGVRGATSTGDCRMCGYGRIAIRAVAYAVIGAIVAVLVSWVVSKVPVLGVVLGIVATLLLARALLMLFIRPHPLVALKHMGVSFALGLVIALLVGLVVR